MDGALLEVEHAFDTLGLDGAMLLASAGGRHLGDSDFDDLLSEPSRRQTVVFTHPTVPPGSRAERLGMPAPILELIFDTTAGPSPIRSPAARWSAIPRSPSSSPTPLAPSPIWHGGSR